MIRLALALVSVLIAIGAPVRADYLPATQSHTEYFDSQPIHSQKPLDIQDDFQTYLLPDDARVVETAIVQMIYQAKHKIRVFAYGFTDKDVCDALIAAHERGVDVALLVDSTQAAGRTQKPLMADLQANGVPVFIGKSWVHHQLIHLKAIICDDSVVESGSMNLSPSGLQQINEVDLIVSPERAQCFEQLWDKLYFYLTGNKQLVSPRKIPGMS